MHPRSIGWGLPGTSLGIFSKRSNQGLVALRLDPRLSRRYRLSLKARRPGRSEAESRDP
jgi:hypothetical protein